MAFALFRVGFEFVAWLTDSVSEWLQDTLVNHFDWFFFFFQKNQFTKNIHSHIELHWLSYFIFFIPFKKSFWFPARLPHFCFFFYWFADYCYLWHLSQLYIYHWLCVDLSVSIHIFTQVCTVQLFPNLQLRSYQPFSLSSKVMFKNACFPLRHTPHQ